MTMGGIFPPGKAKKSEEEVVETKEADLRSASFCV
jgi:hypothetical protein